MAESFEDHYASIRVHILDHPELDPKDKSKPLPRQFKKILESLQKVIDGIDKAEFQATIKIEEPKIPIIIHEVVVEINFLQTQLNKNITIVNRTKENFGDSDKLRRHKLFIGGNQILTKSIRKLQHLKPVIDAHRSRFEDVTAIGADEPLFKDFEATETALNVAISNLETFLKNLHTGEYPIYGIPAIMRQKIYAHSFETLAKGVKALQELESQLKAKTEQPLLAHETHVMAPIPSYSR